MIGSFVWLHRIAGLLDFPSLCRLAEHPLRPTALRPGYESNDRGHPTWQFLLETDMKGAKTLTECLHLLRGRGGSGGPWVLQFQGQNMDLSQSKTPNRWFRRPHGSASVCVELPSVFVESSLQQSLVHNPRIPQMWVQAYPFPQ